VPIWCCKLHYARKDKSIILIIGANAITMRRLHIIVSGDVQGVGYRSWALRYAQGKQLTGWVKNREDGTVEIVAEGAKGALDELIKACRKGPEVAWVTDVAAEWGRATGEFAAFEVIY
jgi:acylphosphatase